MFRKKVRNKERDQEEKTHICITRIKNLTRLRAWMREKKLINLTGVSRSFAMRASSSQSFALQLVSM